MACRYLSAQHARARLKSARAWNTGRTVPRFSSPVFSDAHTILGAGHAFGNHVYNIGLEISANSLCTKTGTTIAERLVVSTLASEACALWDRTWKVMTTTTAGWEAAVGHFKIVRALHLMMELYRDDYVADGMDTELKSLRWDKTANAATTLLQIKHVLAAADDATDTTAHLLMLKTFERMTELQRL